MDAILNIKGVKLGLHFDEQKSPQGRPIRLSGIEKNAKLPEKYVDGSYKSHWIYTFRYIDTLDGFVSFEFDYYDKFVQSIKH